MSKLHVLAVVMGALAWVPASANTLVYVNDFQSGVGAEWSWSGSGAVPTSQAPADTNRKFLGEFIGGETVSLDLAGLPEHDRLQLMFDLYVIRSWDGEGTDYGKDYFTLTSGRDSPATLFNASFANGNPGGQSYCPGDTSPCDERTGALEVNTLGFIFSSWLPDVTWEPTVMDSVYRISLEFDHSDDFLNLNFFAQGLQTYIREDESWGLDNVRISLQKAGEPGTVPEPGSMALLTGGLLGLAWLGRSSLGGRRRGQA